MQNLTGNQWSCIRVGVMGCQGLMPFKTLAAEFCAHCSLFRVLEGVLWESCDVLQVVECRSCDVINVGLE